MAALDDGSSDPCQCAPCRERAQRLPARTAHQLKRLDLTKPPAPILRHTGILIIGIIYCALGAPTALGDWLWAAVLVGFLIWPDITGFTIGGIRLDLKQAKDDIKQAKDDIRTLRNDVNAQARASSTATIALGNDALTTVAQTIAQTTLRVASDLASGPALPFGPPGTGTQTGQDIPS